jgi:type II pantothenate kinase
MLDIDRWRDESLRRHGFDDCFIDLKRRENDAMLPLLPRVCSELDGHHDPREQLRSVIEGVFAGNIFDMGAEATARAFLGQSPDFFATRDSLRRRPWLVDDFEDLSGRLLGDRSPGKAVFFIDNAGSDFLLGALPMIRWLAQCGTSVVLAANERPTLNDMTVHDVRAIWGRVVEAEGSFASLPIDIVSTGTADPLIDLARVSRELNAASAGAELVILEGMGRAIESNYDARFRCDAMNIAMLKDPVIAGLIGGKTFDVVCRYRRA